MPGEGQRPTTVTTPTHKSCKLRVCLSFITNSVTKGSFKFYTLRFHVRSSMRPRDDPKCSPDFLYCPSIAEKSIHWWEIDATVEIHSTGRSFTGTEFNQAASHTYYLLQARPPGLEKPFTCTIIIHSLITIRIQIFRTRHRVISGCRVQNSDCKYTGMLGILSINGPTVELMRNPT